MLEGEWVVKLCNNVQDTAPEFPGFDINFTNDVSWPALLRAARKRQGKGKK